MLNRKADPRNHNDPNIGRERQAPFLFHSEERRHMSYWGSVHSDGLAGFFGFHTDLTTERDDWMSHVRAGEIYNRKAASANIRSYFTLAEEDVLGYEHPVCPQGLGQVDYVVPGDKPSEEGGRMAYRLIFDKVKASEEATQTIARAYLMSYILMASERERASHHVRQR